MTQPKPTNQKPEIRVVVLDLDGTLLDSNHALTPRVEETIKAAVAKGVQIVLATGKTRYSARNLIEQLGIKAPGIYLQGLTIRDAEGELLHQTTLDSALARQAITFGEDRGFTMLAYSGERIFVRNYDEQLHANFARYHEITPEVVGPLQNLLSSMTFNKVIAIGAQRAITALRWQLSMQIGGAGRLMQAGVPTMVELLPPGASKGAALRQLLKFLKVNPENVMAMGDAENDIEMIQLAGIGVAMGQASQDVKDAADYVTASNDADGVAEALERFVLSAFEAEAAEERAEGEAPVVIETGDKPQPQQAQPESTEQQEAAT